MKIIINAILLGLGFTAIIAGRYFTFHDTEGEALINGWPYWLATVALAGIILWFNKIK